MRNIARENNLTIRRIFYHLFILKYGDSKSRLLGCLVSFWVVRLNVHFSLKSWMWMLFGCTPRGKDLTKSFNWCFRVYIYFFFDGVGVSNVLKKNVHGNVLRWGDKWQNRCPMTNMFLSDKCFLHSLGEVYAW